MPKILVVIGLVFILLIGGIALFVVGKYNSIQAKEESVKAAWSQVINVYKRRADLVPNLVNAVKGYTEHEQQTLTQVVEARAKATSMNVNIEDANSLQNFQAAQGELQSALSRLMVVVERYPDLKANKQFEDLQVQLEGTENRITVERQRYIEAVQEFNTFVRMVPTNFIASFFGYGEKPNFTVENERQIHDAPAVNFGK
ncbi:MAG: LemA family protein [Cystobacterineae bacterium]|nr:LemA family protein [Cystobacterineae bacterium]